MPKRSLPTTAPNSDYPELPSAMDDSATRAMCIAAHLNEEFRAGVLREALPTGLTAAGPSLGIDLVAVWRHAMTADERWYRAERTVDNGRVTLAFSLVAFLVGIGGGLVTGSGLWVGLCSVVAVVLVAVFVADSRRRLLSTVRESIESVRLLAHGHEDPRGEPAELDEDEQRIDAVQQGNLIVFSRRSPSPFVGSGIPVEHVVMVPVDVGRAAPSAPAGAPKPFTAIDVHRHLQEVLSERAPDSVRPEHRLYIRGDVISVPGATPWTDREKPPPTSVEQRWVEAGIARPTGQARTYLCLQRAFNGGWLIVSMFVRVTLNGKMLSLETATHALPGLSARYTTPDQAFTYHFDDHVDPREGHTVESACRAVANLMWWNRLFKKGWNGTTGPVERESEDEPSEEAAEEAAESERSAALGERVHDFGAKSSLREQVSRGYLVDQFETLDAQDFLQRAHRAVVDSLGVFLEKHDVDVSEFRTRREQIINNTTFKIQNVQGTGHHIGTQGQVTNVTTREGDSGGDSGNQ